MLRIYSDGEDILIRTGRNDLLVRLLRDLATVCEAVVRTLARNAGCDHTDLRRGLIHILRNKTPDIELTEIKPGVLRISSK